MARGSRQRIKPVLVHGIGRSGTTYLMRLLAGHPQIIADERYPLEFRPFLLSVFPHDQIYQRSIRPARGIPSRDQVDEVYRRLAAAAGKAPVYFAEKFKPRTDMRNALAAEPDARPVVLFRDPRDVLLSARAFDRKRGFRGFLERDGDSDEAVVLKYRDYFAAMITDLTLLRDFQTVHYEELIASPALVAARLFDWLGVDSGSNAVSDIVKRVALADNAAHGTSIAPAISRWRTEMSESLKELYARHFRDLLPWMGYEP